MAIDRETQHAEIFVQAASGHKIHVRCDCDKKVDHEFGGPASHGAVPRSESPPPSDAKKLPPSHWAQAYWHVLLRAFFWGWFRARTQDESEWLYPSGSSEISVAGNDPARILLIGDGPAAGFGVRSHELGIAGNLARQTAERLERGVVVTLVAQPAASARSTLSALGELSLDGYDSIILMMATTDAFCLTTRRGWRRDMSALVKALKSADATSVFVTSTASLHLASYLSPFARRITGNHARTLDIVTGRICEQTGTPMITLDAARDLTSRTYSRWGERIGAQVADSLRPPSPMPVPYGQIRA
ncbi:hypothetical protein HD599_002706 [Conyzicola lurida]|uniref:SGNH/GDSL hydrolase family protein n=1 Tax=Conyzicola lurida TaxID=1172621 RepID=A0A841AS36_9MICO|nr:SGNH/GDSL hydrolase family protein [Conyzicola lurida]MBB5844383.1 hypothetical protein [Conyzicola lurida]